MHFTTKFGGISAFRDFAKEYNVKWNSVSAKHLKYDTITRFKEKVNKIIYDTLNTADHVTLTVDESDLIGNISLS